MTFSVQAICPEDDYAIFGAIKAGDYPKVLDMIEASKGINAVDEVTCLLSFD